MRLAPTVAAPMKRAVMVTLLTTYTNGAMLMSLRSTGDASLIGKYNIQLIRVLLYQNVGPVPRPWISSRSGSGRQQELGSRPLR